MTLSQNQEQVQIKVELSQEGLNVMYAETFLEDQNYYYKKGWYPFQKNYDSLLEKVNEL